MTAPPSPKRRKTTRACDCCRAQKKRCTGTIPCDSCVRNSKKCTFLASYTRGRAVTPPPSTASVLTPGTPSHPALNALGSISSTGRGVSAIRSPSHTTIYTSTNESPHCSGRKTSTREHSGLGIVSVPLVAHHPTGKEDGASQAGSDEVLGDGHFVGPTSVHSWLRQAWSCLGRVRQHVFQLQSALVASSSSTRLDGPIFSHGDKLLHEDHVDDTTVPDLSDKTFDLILEVFFDRGLATYRFLFRPIVTDWLNELRIQDENMSSPPVRAAIVLFMLALGSSYMTEQDKARLPKVDIAVLQSETLFYRARKKLSMEKGAPSVESVQARMLQVHYLLTTSRPNRAWYAFGTVVQLVFALGLHQRSYGKQNAPGLERELRRRTFWSTYKTDKSLSIALGRPSLMREECISQELPEAVNDDQIFADRIETNSDDDCLMDADILQIKLARIIGRSMREYYENDENTLVQLIMSNNQKLAEWKTQLPPFLSGTIRLSSLIPVLRRQTTILKVFHLHTVIFINRPLLLKSFTDSWAIQYDQQIRSSIDACINAASELAKQAVQFNIEGQAFRAFWLSQNMTFNAVSIIYLNCLRLLQGKSSLSDEEYALVTIAEDAQKCLTDASDQNAPAQRYGIVLEQLRLEVRAHIANGQTTSQNHNNVLLGTGQYNDTSLSAGLDGGIDWSTLMSETPLNDASMFWPQFDGLPLGLDDWLGTDFVEPVLDPTG